MSDMACIYEMNMVEENEQMEQDILAGRGMDVLICLIDGLQTGQEIGRRLGMPNYSVHLYLERLVRAGLVKEECVSIGNGQEEKQYSLIADEIRIINHLQEGSISAAEKNRRVELSAQHFALMSRNAIRTVNSCAEAPNRIKAYFMKADREDMEDFRTEIDKLFEKYKKLERPKAERTYSLFSILAPYEVGGEGK